MASSTYSSGRPGRSNRRKCNRRLWRIKTVLAAGSVLWLAAFDGGLGPGSVALASSDDSDPGVITITSTSGLACDPPGVEYTLVICNDGATPLEEVEITDKLPAGMMYIDGSLVGAGLCDSSSSVPADPCPCEGGITDLSLEYIGPPYAKVTVQDDGMDIYYSASTAVGTSILLAGTKSDGRFQKNNLMFIVEEAGTVVEETVIHVSCSQPIGVGFEFGSFRVLSFTSRNGGMYDGDVCTPPPPACPCKGGVTSLTLQFNGESTTVRVEDEGEIIHGPVTLDNASPPFTINGGRTDGRFHKNNLTLYAGDQDTIIHVSCSQPIGIGSVFGPFTVLGLSSRDGGAFNAPCTGNEQGSGQGDDHREGQKVKICLDTPILPGAEECVTITYVATFGDALCTDVKVKGKTGDTAPPGETVKTTTSGGVCIGDALNQALADACGTCLPCDDCPPGEGGTCDDIGTLCESLLGLPDTGACDPVWTWDCALVVEEMSLNFPLNQCIACCVSGGGTYADCEFTCLSE